MLITKDEFMEYLNLIGKDIQALEVYTRKSKSLEYKMHVPEEVRYRYIELTYVQFLGNKILKMLKKGVPTNKIVESLKVQNWKEYSLSSKAYYGENLYKILFERKTTSQVNLLTIQAYYLGKASMEIIEYLEG